MIRWIVTIGSIVLSDLVLSGDNALIIGVAASGLPKKQRLWAIVCGGGGAIVLRILFTILASVALQIPFIGACGSIILLGIAVKILLSRSKDANRTPAEVQYKQEALKQKGAKRLLVALLTILAADVTMSLDNILAVGALASGNILFLIIGLVISLCILLVGSSFIAKLMDHLPWLLDIACLILAWTASHIFLGDESLQNFIADFPWIQYIAPILAIAIVSITDIYLCQRTKAINAKRY